MNKAYQTATIILLTASLAALFLFLPRPLAAPLFTIILVIASLWLLNISHQALFIPFYHHSGMAAWVAHRPSLSAGLIWLLLGTFMLKSAYVFNATPDNLDYALIMGLLWATCGLVCLWACLSLKPKALPTPPTTSPEKGLDWRGFNGHLFLLGALALILSAEMGADFLIFFNRTPPALQFMTFTLGLGLIVAGCGGLSMGFKPSQSAGRAWRGELAFLCALGLLALALRLYKLEDSVRFLVDELHFSDTVTHFLFRPESLNIFDRMSGIAPHPRLFAYWEYLSAELFGRNFFALRLPSAILGMFTVLAVYLVGRSFFDRLTGLAAACILIAFPPHLHFSRLGLNQIGDGLMATLIMAFVGRALHQGRARDYALGGLALGLAHYFYEGGRLLMLAVVAAWLLAAWLMGTFFKVEGRPSKRGVALLILTAALVSFPFYYTYLGQGYNLIERLETAGYEASLLERLYDDDLRKEYFPKFKATFQLYLSRPDDSPYYGYFGLHPLLLIYLAPFALIGAGVVILRWRGVALGLIVWLMGNNFGNMLLVEAAHSSRYLAVFSLLALLVGLGLRTWLGLILRGRALYIAVLSLAVLITGAQADYYFNQHLPHFLDKARAERSYDSHDTVLRSVDFPAGTLVHIIGGENEFYFRNALRYLNDDLQVRVLSRENFTINYFYRLSDQIDHAFFIPHDDLLALAMIQTFFRLEPPQYSPDPTLAPERAFVLYYAPAEDQ